MSVHVEVPATSANLGPGFDSLGIALDLHDVVEASASFGGSVAVAPRVEVSGVGEGEVPLDERHLVVQAMAAAFAELGIAPTSLVVRCHNVIPHGRGLGSSAAAIVAGVAAARALAGVDPVGEDALALAGRLEGHPDNVAPCLLGGLTVAWSADDGRARAARSDVHSAVRPVVCIPDQAVPTTTARGLLPATVSHADAAHNAGRAALLVHALTQRPDLLLSATEDRLHQSYRAPAMTGTFALVESLRAAGLAAVVSGAGPSVLVLTVGEQTGAVRARAHGWDVRELAVQPGGVRVIDPATATTAMVTEPSG